MREILFRGKRRSNGEWLYGFCAKCEPRLSDIRTEPRSWIQTIDDAGVALFLEEVDPETVGQYTGTKDANGKRIFDGDIIQIRFEGDAYPPSTPPVWYETGKVIWHDQLHGWRVVFDDLDGISLAEYNDCDDVFVIGSIHDNPELLEVEHET